jgi:hypothetical protein
MYLNAYVPKLESSTIVVGVTIRCRRPAWDSKRVGTVASEDGSSGCHA